MNVALRLLVEHPHDDCPGRDVLATDQNHEAAGLVDPGLGREALDERELVDPFPPRR